MGYTKTLSAHSLQADFSDPSPRTFRDALGRFATGVVLITAKTPTGNVGLAVNYFGVA